MSTAGSLASRDASGTHKLYETAIKAARNRLTQIEQALLDVFTGANILPSLIDISASASQSEKPP